MASNKRRRSSDGCSPSSTKFLAIQKQPSPNSMFISLPVPRIPTPICHQMKRRSPLTPPSVTPPSVSDSTTMQRPRDRCSSPRASALLAKVAVVSATPGTIPSSPRMCAASPETSSLESSNSTPTATPPDEGAQFLFSSPKQLPESPNGGYVSFPMFEAFCGCSDVDDGSVTPGHR